MGLILKFIAVMAVSILFLIAVAGLVALGIYFLEKIG